MLSTIAAVVRALITRLRAMWTRAPELPAPKDVAPIHGALPGPTSAVPKVDYPSDLREEITPVETPQPGNQEVTGPPTVPNAGLPKPTPDEEPVKLVYFKGMEHLSSADLRALDSAAKWIGIKTDWLDAAIAFETANTFSPSKPNAAGSGAMGLIQFMPQTAVNLGIIPKIPNESSASMKARSQAALSKMSFREQLEWVKRYFAPERGKLHSLEDVYLTIFYPKEIGRSPDDIIAREGTPVYEQNAGFDRGGKGWITRSDVTATIVNKLNGAIATGQQIVIPTAIGTGVALAMGAAAYGIYHLAKGGSEAA